MADRNGCKRPKYALEGSEDEVYHDLRLGDRATEPEYCAFVGRSPVFNRAMKWRRTSAGNILCYCPAEDLPLTGSSRVSEWYSDPANTVQQTKDCTRFVKKAPRRRDCVVLPGLQFSIHQHPLASLSVTRADVDWQFCVLIKGRSGPPFISSGWKTGPGIFGFDLYTELQKLGYALSYPELHFALGVWSDNPKSKVAVSFEVSLTGRKSSVIVPCLPVIRTAKTASSKGVPVAAVVPGSRGRLLGKTTIKLTAVVNGDRVALREKDGIWTGRIKGLGAGEHRVGFIAEDDSHTKTYTDVRITDGDFVSFDSSLWSLVRNRQITGPLTGSYQGSVFFRNAGSTHEAIVQGQEQWDAWDRSRPRGEHWHYWESLTEDELDRRFAYLKQCGWHILHLCQHWGIWEKLDAGGRIAPHGAEQLALYLRVAARHGLFVLQALTHYPYGSKWTPPSQPYIDAGFTDEDWKNPDTLFTDIFHDYLRDFTMLFKEEAALFAMTASGEGDATAGAKRVNDTHDFIKSRDRNHIFLAEPIHRMQKLPRDYVKGWKGELFGSRLYRIGYDMEPELDLGVELKLVRTNRVFVAEGNWPCPPLYAKFAGYPDSWMGTEIYRRRVRDSLYLGLVHRIPIILTWDEQCTEDERIIFDEVRRLVDWQQPFLAPPLGIRVDGDNITSPGRQALIELERLFTAVPVSSRYLIPDRPQKVKPAHVLDARKKTVRPGVRLVDETLMNVLEGLSPISISKGYRASYLWSENRKTLLAYIYNGSRHVFMRRYQAEGNLCGTVHRSPDEIPLTITTSNLSSGKLQLRLYDLDAKRLRRQGSIHGKKTLHLGSTASDFLLLVSPKNG